MTRLGVDQTIRPVYKVLWGAACPMRRAILLCVLAMLVPQTAAVVGANDTGGDMHIMGGGSSASASTGVGPDGTSYQAEITPRNASCTTEEDAAVVTDTAFFTQNASTDRHGVAFTGRMAAADPCHELDHAVERINESAYALNITTQPGSGMCVQCTATLTYRASFSAQDPFMLTVRHDGRTVETLSTPGRGMEEETGIITSLLDWLGRLF